MEAIQEKFDLRKLDKKDWVSFRFEEIANRVSVSVDPNTTILKKYVGLEHIDPDDIHIRRFGSPDDVSGGKLKCYPGDVIFGKRRAYQRKAAIVEFEGICSAHAFVFRANPEVIDPKLFPFFLHSDQFMHRMVDISVGGLSPTINWGDLKNQEFLLPPKSEQARLAELLWAMDEVIEREKRLKETADTLYEVSKSTLVLEGINNEITFSEELKRNVSNKWRITTVGKLLSEKYLIKIQDGNHGEIHPKSSDYVEEGIPFIMANTLIDGVIDFEKSKKLPQSITDKLRIGFSYSNDVLLSHKGTVGEVALVPENIEYPYLMLTPQVTLYRVNPDKLLNRFLYYVFNASYFQNQILRLSSQSTRAYVGITSQRGFKLSLPNSIEEQQEIIEVLSKIERNRQTIDKSISSSKALQKSLINQIFKIKI